MTASAPPSPSHLRRQVWNWLPAFLEVAETGSVHRASRNLSLTPAAVSRTIRLLQEEVGVALFNRVGRGLVLNRAGEALRDSVRRAASGVDGGLGRVLGDPFVGPLRVASLGILTEHFTVAAMLALKADHPGLVPEHRNLRPAEANGELVRGQLDVAFYYEDLTAEEVVVEPVGHASSSIYCGRGHPLFRARRITGERVLSHAFSVPQVGDTGRVMDGWPPDLHREVGMRITLLGSNLEVCRSGALLTVLPDVTALPHVQAGELRRLPVVELPPIEMFAARHVATGERGAVRELIEDVRGRIADAETAVARTLRRRSRSRRR